MKVAAVQMVSGLDLGRNLDAAGRLVAEAAAAGAALVALPEWFCLVGGSDEAKRRLAERPGDGPIQRFLAEAAKRHGVWLVGGTLPLVAPGDGTRLHNASLVFAPDGRLAARYDKRHLFRFDDGRERHDESSVLDAGGDAVAVDAAGWRVGLSVCYDLRFPEHYRALMRPPCDLLAVPSAFTQPTGEAHWHVLLRARAIENQAYVIAPAQGGVHENGRRTYGHSLVVDPWGVVVAERADDGEGVVVATLERERIASVRRRLPALEHRRG